MSRKHARGLESRTRRSFALLRTSLSIAGPLPPPEVLQRYEQVVEGSAERILRMAELQAGHRRELERSVVAGDLAASRRGALFAFVLGLVVVLGASA